MFACAQGMALRQGGNRAETGKSSSFLPLYSSSCSQSSSIRQPDLSAEPPDAECLLLAAGEKTQSLRLVAGLARSMLRNCLFGSE